MEGRCSWCPQPEQMLLGASRLNRDALVGTPGITKKNNRVGERGQLGSEVPYSLGLLLLLCLLAGAFSVLLHSLATHFASEASDLQSSQRTGCSLLLL